MILSDFFRKIREDKKYRVVSLILFSVAVFIVAGAVAAKRYRGEAEPPPKTTPVVAPRVQEQLVTSPLDGLSYKEELARRHPLAVVIENHPSARPQSGLSEASIVYEAIAEGGITRFLAIFGPRDAEEVGPVRSARLFFMDWLKEYDAFFAHAGGAEDALTSIGTYNIKDLNHRNSYYWRDNKGRAVGSEHTLYSSTEKLYQYAADKGFGLTMPEIEALKFTAARANPEGIGVEVDFSRNATYKVRWEYDPASNSYLRFMGDAEHKDRTTGEQLKAKNIIVQEVSRTIKPQGSYGKQIWTFRTTGEGEARIFQNGREITATWKKADRNSRTRFYGEDGSEIAFVPGQIWYQITAPDTSGVRVF